MVNSIQGETRNPPTLRFEDAQSNSGARFSPPLGNFTASIIVAVGGEQRSVGGWAGSAAGRRTGEGRPKGAALQVLPRRGVAAAGRGESLFREGARFGAWSSGLDGANLPDWDL